MSSPIDSQIKDRISAFVSELDLLVRKGTLEALHGFLSGNSSPRRGRPAGKRGPGRPRGASSANVDDAAAKITAHVRSNDGQGIGAIAKATGVALPVAKKAALRLLAEGALKKSGQRRGTCSCRLPRRNVTDVATHSPERARVALEHAPAH